MLVACSEYGLPKVAMRFWGLEFRGYEKVEIREERGSREMRDEREKKGLSD